MDSIVTTSAAVKIFQPPSLMSKYSINASGIPLGCRKFVCREDLLGVKREIKKITIKLFHVKPRFSDKLTSLMDFQYNNNQL